MARPAAAAAFALLLAGAAGCVYSPRGRCDAAADCATEERCDAGVCVPSKTAQIGVDPSSLTSVTWAQLLGASNATFEVDSIGADLAGNVVVAGAVDAAFDFAPSALGTGAFVAKRASVDGAGVWAVSFPSFSHGELTSAILPRGTVFEAAVLPGGDVFFAGTAFDRTAIGTVLAYDPPIAGALVFGRLDVGGNPLWVRAVADTHPTSPLVPAAVTVNGAGDLLVAGAGSGDFGCASGDTGGATFAAALSGLDGSCLWSRGFGTQTLSDLEPSGATSVVVAGVCTPAGAPFDPGGATTCTRGLFVAVLSGGNGATRSLRTTGGTGTVSAVGDLTIAPDGHTTVVGNASGVVDFGNGGVDFATEGSFAVTFDAAGAATVVRPVEAPYAADPDELAFSRCAYDPTGRLWIAGRYIGQPTLGGVRFSACPRPDCLAASFLARLEADGSVSSFLPIRAALYPGGGAYVDDLALFATSGTVAHALRFKGVAQVGGKTWSSAAKGLGILRVVP